MSETTRKIQVKIAIEQNLKAIKDKFREGYERAMYGNLFQMGILKAYEKLNNFLPDDIRKDMSFYQAMIFNSWILGHIATMIRHNFPDKLFFSCID